MNSWRRDYRPADRADGNFYWGKIANGINITNPEAVFLGMFDEYNEATAIMPMSVTARLLAVDHVRVRVDMSKPSEYRS